MTILIDDASTPLDPESGIRSSAPGSAIAAARRGRTQIGTNVIETIVGHVAVETPGVSAAALTGVRGWFGSDRPDVASARVEHSSTGVHVALEVAVTYPQSITDVSEQLRNRVITALDAQMAVAVERVDITVTELRRDAGQRVTVEEDRS